MNRDSTIICQEQIKQSVSEIISEVDHDFSMLNLAWKDGQSEGVVPQHLTSRCDVVKGIIDAVAMLSLGVPITANMELIWNTGKLNVTDFCKRMYSLKLEIVTRIKNLTQKVSK